MPRPPHCVAYPGEDLLGWRTGLQFRKLHRTMMVRSRIQSATSVRTSTSSLSSFPSFLEVLQINLVKSCCDVLFLSIMCFTSEASWLKQKQNQLSPVPVRHARFDIHGLNVWSGKPLPLQARTGSSLKQTRNKGTTKVQSLEHVPIFFRKFLHATRKHVVLPSHPTILLQLLQDGRSGWFTHLLHRRIQFLNRPEGIQDSRHSFLITCAWNHRLTATWLGRVLPDTFTWSTRLSQKAFAISASGRRLVWL